MATSGLKKPPSFSNNGVSTSFKHIYDDVFASPPHTKLKSPSFIEDDYGEIFGSSKSSNGTWSISYSSIPVLDLPPSTELRVRGVSGVTTISGGGGGGGGEVDFGGVFGGSGDGNLCLLDGEKLFDQFKRKAKTSLDTMPRSKRQTSEATGPEVSRQFQDGQSTINGFPQSFDSVKHFPNKSNGTATRRSGEQNKAASLRDALGSIYSYDEADPAQKTLFNNTPIIPDNTNPRQDVNLAKKQGKHSRHTSSDLGTNERSSEQDTGSQKAKKQANHSRHISSDLGAIEQNADCDAGFQRASLLTESNSIDASRDTSETSTAPTNGFSRPFDNSKYFEDKNNKVSIHRTSEGTLEADVHATPVSNLSTGSSVIEDDTQTHMAVTLSQKQGNHSRNNSSVLGVNVQNSEHDAGSPNASQVSSSVPLDTSCDTCDVSTVAGPSKAMRNDTTMAVDFDVVKKKGRHSRMTSLDLGDHKHSRGCDGGLQRKPRFGSSYSFDASHDPCTARIKVQPSKMAPSSSLHHFFPMESHYKVSENSSCRSCETNLGRGFRGSPPSLDEQLDMNSDAAVSAAALQRAIEEAEMRIRWAKEFLEREGQGSRKLRFKDTLKVKVAQVDALADEVGKFQQTKIYERCQPVQVEMQTCSVPERKSVSGKAQVIPSFEGYTEFVKDEPFIEDQKKFDKDEEQTEVKNGSISKLIDESDKREGGLKWEAAKPVLQKVQVASLPEDHTESVKDDSLVKNQKKFDMNEEHIEVNYDNTSKLIDDNDKREGVVEWEAARHLNQIISGVKSRIASFMIWQTDTEKKEEPKETEESTNLQQQSEEGEPAPVPDLNYLEAFEVKGAEKIQDAADCTVETIHEESEFELVPEAVVLDENDSIKSDTVEPEKAGNEVDVNPDVAGPASANFMFFAFRNERVCDPLDPQEGKKRGSQESMEVEDDSVQEQVMNEIKDEQIQNQHEEHNCEGLDDLCMNRDSPRQEHMYSHGDPSNEEINEIVEEPYPFVDDREVATDEGDNNRRLDEECGEEPMLNSQFPEDTIGITPEKGGCEEECEVVKVVKNQQDSVQKTEETNPGGESGKSQGNTDGTDGCQEIETDQCQTNHIERVSPQTFNCEEIKRDESLNDHIEETGVEVAEKASGVAAAERELKHIESDQPTAEEESCIAAVEHEHKETETDEVDEFAEKGSFFATAEEECEQLENVFLFKAKDTCGNGERSSRDEPEVPSDEETESMEDLTKPSSEPELELKNPAVAQMTTKLIGEETELSSVLSTMEFDGIKVDVDGDQVTLEFEDFVSHDGQSDASSEIEDIDVEVMFSDSQDNFENQADNVHGSEETLNMGEAGSVSDLGAQVDVVEAVHKRRRWFENGGKVGAGELAGILEGKKIGLGIDQEIVDESDLAGSVEIHADKLDSDIAEVTAGKITDAAVNQNSQRINVEATHKRRRWFVNRGEEGLPEPPPLFEDVKITLEEPRETVNVPLPQSKSHNKLEKVDVEIRKTVDVAVAPDGIRDKQSVETAPRRKRWFESGENVGTSQQLRTNEDTGMSLETDQQSKEMGEAEEHREIDDMPIAPEKAEAQSKVEPVIEHPVYLGEVSRRDKEKEKEKIAVERVIREARERAFAEARERARRDAVDRPNVEAHHRAAAGAQERLGKVSAETRSSSEKAAVEAKLRAERAAVERATAEARERALKKSLSDKASQKSREQDTSFQSSTSYSRHDASNKGETFDGMDGESAERRKARLERQSRTMERAAKALDEKNKRDLLAQKEQAAKNMLADSLDAEVKRWSCGKEGNLRALLSTLQYILGPNSGWQAVSLTDLMAATAVRKAYKKATLCVHPDKLQQRGATIQQKYICEKVFDLLKEAWSKLNPDER